MHKSRHLIPKLVLNILRSNEKITKSWVWSSAAKRSKASCIWKTYTLRWPKLLKPKSADSLMAYSHTSACRNPPLSARHPMPCWTISNHRPNSILIDSSHCWWTASWASVLLFNTSDKYRQISSTSLSLIMLTPRPHLPFSSMTTYTRMHKHRMHVKLLSNQQSKVNNAGRRQQIVYRCVTSSEALRCGMMGGCSHINAATA